MKKLILIALAAMSTSVFAEQVLYICPTASSLDIKKCGSKWVVTGKLTKQVAGQSSKFDISQKVYVEGAQSVEISSFDSAFTDGASLIGCSYQVNPPFHLVLTLRGDSSYAGKNCKLISTDTIQCDLPAIAGWVTHR
jgi:hypothetical protein